MLARQRAGGLALALRSPQPPHVVRPRWFVGNPVGQLTPIFVIASARGDFSASCSPCAPVGSNTIYSARHVWGQFQADHFKSKDAGFPCTGSQGLLQTLPLERVARRRPRIRALAPARRQLGDLVGVSDLYPTASIASFFACRAVKPEMIRACVTHRLPRGCAEKHGACTRRRTLDMFWNPGRGLHRSSVAADLADAAHVRSSRTSASTSSARLYEDRSRTTEADRIARRVVDCARRAWANTPCPDLVHAQAFPSGRRGRQARGWKRHSAGMIPTFFALPGYRTVPGSSALSASRPSDGHRLYTPGALS